MDDTQTSAGSPAHTILVADDEASIRSMLADALDSTGYRVVQAANGNEVLRSLAGGKRPDLVLLDLRMPDLSGIDVVQRLNEQKIDVPVLLMTAHGTSTSAIKAMQLGVEDYIAKPFDLDDLLHKIGQVLKHRQLQGEVQRLRALADRDPNDRIVGQSARMLEVYKLIGRVARSDATVLITGETGTGKELVAETIHANSGYRTGAIIKVAIPALPETLLESELFGHEKGAFTNAVAQRKGRFEMAHKGSIFLDEIGEMTLGTQRKLLRVLQEREFERVGGSTPIQIDTRVIAATNRSLEQEVALGRFREDLMYRLKVFTIEMPPLRDRKDDIPLLVEHFLDKHRFTTTSAPARISEEAMNSLQAHDWPGNVRELENTIERAVVLAQGGVITSQQLITSRTEGSKLIDIKAEITRGRHLQDLLADVEREAILAALRETSGSRTRAADRLDVPLRAFLSKMRDHGLIDAADAAADMAELEPELEEVSGD